MTQRQLERAVAGATGESLRTVRGLGFGVLEDGPAHGPGDLSLVLDCPFCRAPGPYPGPAGDGSAALAECLTCDVYFDYGPGGVYASGW